MKIILAALLSIIPILVIAKRPLYEVGVAAGVAKVPDYPGSNQDQSRVIAFPSFFYRGEILRQDRRGSRARLFKSENFDIDISFGAAFNANSDNNKTREGMEDLDWIFEVGPRANYSLYSTDKILIELELPLRFATSTDLEYTRQRGMRISPQIDFRNRFHQYFTYSFSHKLNYATEELNDFFYQVESKDQTVNREAFNAHPGFVGSSTSLSLLFRKDNLFLITGISYANFSGSANQDSPLFKSEHGTSLYFAFNYFFYQSKKLVD